MGKKVLIFLVSLFFIQSCSWITNFYVLNKSNEPILVVFKHPRRPETTPYLEKIKSEKPELYQKIKPTPCPIKENIEIGKYPEICDEGFKNCKVLSSNEFKFNEEECSLELTLESSKSVKLFDICCSYTGVKENSSSDDSDRGQKKDDNAFELTIKSTHGTIYYKGIKLLRGFKKKNKTTYILEYEE